ncbi:MAG: hypothetical protein IPN53_12725 [Comamonadaceae bacterium]|nr:hypothetical protein [Comamonadaceae bacterium]
MANLGYYDARYLRPVYAGDTIRSLTKVMDRKERGVGKPGIVTIRTLGLNRTTKWCFSTRERSWLTGKVVDRHHPAAKRCDDANLSVVEQAEVLLPNSTHLPAGLTGPNSWFGICRG